VASFGATPTIYGDGLEARLRELLPDGATAAIDTVGTQEAIDVSLALVADESRIASINAFGKTDGTGIKLLGSGPGADAGSEVRKAARGTLVTLAGAGELRVIVGPEFGLADARAAFDAAGGGHPGGKVVLLP
jgi:NADPH:quinone reductase-like Zn-dependent oxidoreductase